MAMNGHEVLLHEPFSVAEDAAEAIIQATGVSAHHIAVVLGSGWSAAADELGKAKNEIAMSNLPGFIKRSVPGHVGTVRSVAIGSNNVLVFLGRTHLYEGFGVEAAVHAVRTAAKAGCKIIILTNGCGSLNPNILPGTVVVIADHDNQTGVTPLRGAKFLNMVDAYSPRLQEIAFGVDSSFRRGVYIQLPGPEYETPATVRRLRAMQSSPGGTLYGDALMNGVLVGMSTAAETIAAREAGMEVLGLSLVTNLGAGMTGAPINHKEVIDVGQAHACRLGKLIADIIARI
jgi:purine-nucleoside phosphorylase